LIFINISIIQVSSGTVIIKERFGKFYSILKPGIHMIIPLIETIKYVNWKHTLENRSTGRNYQETLKICKIPVNEQTYDFPECSVITNDVLRVKVNGILFYKIIDPFKAVYQIDDLLQAMEQLVLTSLRDTISKMDLVKAIKSEQEIQKLVIQNLKKLKDEWGTEISRIDIQSILPSNKIMDSNETVVIKRREAEAQILKVQAERDCKLLNMKTENELKEMEEEGKRKIEKIKADSAAEIKKIESDSIAYGIISKAKAESERSKLECESKGNYIKMMLKSGVNQNYLEVLEHTRAWKELSKNASKGTFIIPYDSTKFLGNHIINNTSQIKNSQKD